MSRETGGPAFPETERRLNPATGTYIPILRRGLTIRDYFAAQALAGEINYAGLEGNDTAMLAAMAYEMADAMIAERSK